jgi:hypothetical protein
MTDISFFKKRIIEEVDYTHHILGEALDTKRRHLACKPLLRQSTAVKRSIPWMARNLKE